VQATSGALSIAQVTGSELANNTITNSNLASGSFGNITGVGTLTSGALGAGFTTVAVAQGGTGATSFTSDQLLVGNGTGAIQSLGAGTTGQILESQGAGALPTWVAASSSCTDCVLNDPTTSARNTIAPSTNGVTGLTVQGTSGGGTADIFDVQNTGGTTTYIGVGSTGTITLGGSLASTGLLHTNASGQLSTSLVATGDISNSAITNAKLATGTFSNITGVGTLGSLTVSGTSTLGTVTASGTVQFSGITNSNAAGIIHSDATGNLSSSLIQTADIAGGAITNAKLATGTFSNITGLGTLTGLAVTGATTLTADAAGTVPLSIVGHSGQTGDYLDIST